MDSISLGCLSKVWQVHTGPFLQVARVGVHSGHLLEVQQFSKAWLLGQCTQQQVDVSHTNRLIRLLMEHLQSLPHGQYLLTHQPGANAVCCYTAVEEQHVNSMVSYHLVDRTHIQTLWRSSFIQSGTSSILTYPQHTRPCALTQWWPIIHHCACG